MTTAMNLRAMNPRSMPAIPAALAVALLAGAPMAVAADQDVVVGRAGEIVVSQGQIRAYLDALPLPDRAALGKDPDALARAVRTYMAERLVLKAAQDAGFDTKPEVAAQLARARDGLLMDLFLQAEATVPADYPSETQVRALYEENRGKLVAPPRYRLSQIFIAAPKEQATSAKLDAVTVKLKGKGAASASGFAALAKTYSDSNVEAARGGEIGWLAETAVAPEILEALKGLKPGAVTPPVRLTNGWHVVRLMEVKPAGTTPAPFDTVKDQFARQMRRQRIEQARRDFISALIARSEFILDDNALKALAADLK